MQYPKEKLQNRFYFINDNVVYNISTRNDSLKTGRDFVDENTDPVTKKVDEDSCAQIFPNIKVVYDKSNGDQVTKYYWLQNMITDGDIYDGATFSPNSEGDKDKNQEADGASTYLDLFSNQVEEEIIRRINNGQTITSIKKSMPYYIFAKDGDVVKIDGEEVTINTIENNDMGDRFDDEAMYDIFYGVVNVKTINYANKLLAKNGKKLVDDAVLVSKENVKDIDDVEPEPTPEPEPSPEPEPEPEPEPTILTNVKVVYVGKNDARVDLVDSNFNLSLLSRVKIDGSEVTPTQNYSFSDTQKHEVEYSFVDTTTLPSSMFSNCDLDEVYVLNQIETISSHAFNGGTQGIERFDIESTVPLTTIESGAFQGRNINQMNIFLSTPPTISGSEFDNVRDINVPSSKEQLYKETWPQYASKITGRLPG